MKQLSDYIYYEEPAGVIYCGDCLEILPLLPDKSIDLVLADPPYGVGVNYTKAYNDKRSDYWKWLALRVDVCINLNTILIISHCRTIDAILHLPRPDWIGVWHKPCSMGARLGNSMVLPHWESLLMWGIHKAGTKSKYTSDVFVENPQPAGNNSKLGREKWSNPSNAKHPCPKPLHLITKLITAFALSDGIVLDPFLGSGTTAVAAKNLGRKFIGIEIEPKYCEIAKQRLAQEVLL